MGANPPYMLTPRNNSHSFDLRAHIPYHSLTEDQRDDLWDDGLHMTPAGYNRMGQHIADALIRLIQQEEEEQQLAKAKPRVKEPVTVKADRSIPDQESGNAKDQEGHQAKAKPRTRKSAARKDDILVFDEETGDAKNISQGYVVVRKRDLE